MVLSNDTFVFAALMNMCMGQIILPHILNAGLEIIYLHLVYQKFLPVQAFQHKHEIWSETFGSLETF